MKKGKKVILAVLAVLLIVAAFFAGKILIKPDSQKLAQEIHDNLKTKESYELTRHFYSRIEGNFEFDGEKYAKADNAESIIEIHSKMKVTNNPYHLETEGKVTEEAHLPSESLSPKNETDYQLVSDEKDGLGHLTMDNETENFEYTHRPTLHLELFEGIAKGSIKAEYSYGDDWNDLMDYLYLDVTLSGDVLENLFLDEERVLYGYDLDNIDWDVIQMPCTISIDKHTHEPLGICTRTAEEWSVVRPEMQKLVNQSFPDWDNYVSNFYINWSFGYYSDFGY